MEKEKKKKKKKASASQEGLLAELDVHKMEFSALRGEILYWLDAEKQHLNLSIVAIGATIGFIAAGSLCSARCQIRGLAMPLKCAVR